MKEEKVWMASYNLEDGLNLSLAILVPQLQRLAPAQWQHLKALTCLWQLFDWVEKLSDVHLHFLVNLLNNLNSFQPSQNWSYGDYL